jgi:hypothetical protein
METWYKQQDFFDQAKLDAIKAWTQPGNVNLIDMQEYKAAS